MSDATPAVRVVVPEPSLTKGYLFQLDLFRVLVFACVIGQHAVLWPVPQTSVVGWGMVMLLHATRQAFFFLSVLVATLSQLRAPRSVPRFCLRRLSEIGVPYLFWTAVYFAYTMIVTPASFDKAMAILGGDLRGGYYQLYFLVVLAQIYVVLPLFFWLARVTRGHHGWVLSVSAALELAMTTVHHYLRATTGFEGSLHRFSSVLLWPRRGVAYEFFVVAAVLAAEHFAEWHAFALRHTRQLLWAVAAVGVANEVYYLVVQAIDHNPGYASDLYQPVAEVWFAAAIVGVYCLGCRYAARFAESGPSRTSAFVTLASDASGGIYLSHVLVLQLVFSGLAPLALPWGATAAILYVTTVIGATALVMVFLRSPVRRIVTGPDRRAERERLAVAHWPAEEKTEAMAGVR
jgi:peptidoglycan/LPS O-acetylase OafA/YrhL